MPGFRDTPANAAFGFTHRMDFQTRKWYGKMGQPSHKQNYGNKHPYQSVLAHMAVYLISLKTATKPKPLTWPLFKMKGLVKLSKINHI